MRGGTDTAAGRLPGMPAATSIPMNANVATAVIAAEKPALNRSADA